MRARSCAQCTSWLTSWLTPGSRDRFGQSRSRGRVDGKGSAVNESGDVTRLLAAISGGDHAAWDALFPLVYERLQVIAHRQLRGERTGHTLATSDLVHEAYFSLVGIESVSWTD